MALTAAELQKRHELEGAPDPFPSLGPSSPVRTKAVKTSQAPLELDTDSQILFPSLAPSPASAAATTAAPAASAWGSGPRIKATPVVKAPTYSDSFTLANINLTIPNKDGTFRQTTLSEVMKQVMARHKVKIDASANQRIHTFHLKSEFESELDKAKKNLIAWLSPINKTIVNAPASTIALIIGAKGQTLKQIREQTNVRIDIPPKDSITNGSASGTATPINKENDEEEEIMIPITVEGAAPLVEEAVALINAIIGTRVAKTTQRVKDIPAHVLPFVISHKNNFESMVDFGSVVFSHNASEHEIIVSGERDAVNRVIESVKVTVDGYKKNLTSIKMTLPKRQHRLLQDAAVEEILAKSKCAVVVASPEDVSDEVVVWGQGQDLPNGLTAVMERANSQHIHEFPLPGPITFSRQLLAYMTRIDYASTLCTNHWGVNVYTPHPSVVEKASILNIDIVGEKADVDTVVRQISELIGKLLGGIREITIDWLLHRVITGKHAKKIRQFHDAHNVSVYFPPEDSEKSEVLLVYDPMSPSASLSPDEKAKHLEDVAAELLKMAKETGDVKSKTISVEKRWHDAVLGQNGTTLNAIIGEEKALSIKVGAEAGDPNTEDVIVIRGTPSDVDRAAKEILKIAEDAKNDVIVSSYSTEVEVDREYIGRIVGAQGAGFNKLREQLGVKVDAYGDGEEKDGGKRKKGGATHQKSKIVITGRKENAEEAKKRILAQVERFADETQETLNIPVQYHASLIGQSGKYAIRLEEKYAVKITFPRHGGDGGEGRTREQLKSDEVLIKGGKKGVAGAKSELLEALEFEKESNNVIHFTVPQRAVARILGKGGAQINEIKDETDAQIDVEKPGAGEEFDMVKITVRGTKEAVAAAQAKIKAIANQVADETTANISIEQRFHRTIIGAGGQGLKDLVARCGGPTDSRLQAGLIRFPRQGDENMDEVRLRGDSKLVNKLKAELEKIVNDLKSRVVLAAEVPVGQHSALIGRGGQHLNELQTRFGVQIQFPGSRSYNQVGEPENAAELEFADPANIVKVSGPRPACEKAIAALKSQIKSQVKPPSPVTVTETVTVPFKYHHSVLQQGAFLRSARNNGVTIDMSAQPNQPAVPSQPPSNGASEARIDDLEDTSGVSWEIIPNYQNAEEGSATWTLKARDQAGLDWAIKSVQDNIARAERMSHVGFLTLSDRSSFPRIVGAKGSNVARLRDETGADITVGKDNNTIVIVGAEENILAAKDAILATVNRPRRD